mgnify:CR=1 FL=1
MSDIVQPLVIRENDFLSDHSPQDKPWDVHKSQTDEVSCLYLEADVTRYAERAFDCSTNLTFGLNPDNKLKLTDARFCRLRYCPTCQWRRSKMWRARAYERLPKVIEEHPTARWVFLTLTVRNCPVTELRNTLRDMNAAWNRLTGRKTWPGLGFFRSTEVTRGEDGSAHPHFHVLMPVKASYFSTGYIKQAEWAELWRECLRADYTPVVDIRTVKKAKDTAEGIEALRAAIQEVLKYTTKPTDLMASSEWLVELTQQTHKLRFIATGGILKDALGDIEPKTDDDLIHFVDETPVEPAAPRIRFQFDRETKRYRSRKTVKT